MGAQEKPKNKAHKDVKYWYKFQNEIVFDGVPYTVTFSIRDKGKEQYAYFVDFHEKSEAVDHNDTAQKSFAQAGQTPHGISIAQNSEKSSDVGGFSLEKVGEGANQQTADDIDALLKSAGIEGEALEMRENLVELYRIAAEADADERMVVRSAKARGCDQRR